MRIAKKFNDLHAQYADKIIAAMKKNVADGSPVNPPIWWIDPLDKDALKEDTGEFSITACTRQLILHTFYK